MPVADQFYRDEAGGVIDPARNMWRIATDTTPMPDEDLQAAARKAEADSSG